MNPLSFPWLELAIIITLVGSPIISLIRDPNRAYLACLFCTGTALMSALLAWLGFAVDSPANLAPVSSIQPALFGRVVFAFDDLNAPMIAAVALLHFLVVVATARTHMRRFTFATSLGLDAIRLATFSCVEP